MDRNDEQDPPTQTIVRNVDERSESTEARAKN